MDTKAEDHPPDLHNTTPRDLTTDGIQAVSTDRPVTGPTAEWPAGPRDVIVPSSVGVYAECEGVRRNALIVYSAGICLSAQRHYTTLLAVVSLVCTKRMHVYTGYTSSL